MTGKTTESQILDLEYQLAHHQAAIQTLQQQIRSLRSSSPAPINSPSETPVPITGLRPPPPRYPLSPAEYSRYGRQLIVPSLGLSGQLALKRSAVLIIGAGGLGCPAAAYLAGVGVGQLGIVDGDTVEESNLHRQIAHGGKVGQSKADSLKNWCETINPLVVYESYPFHLTPTNALNIVSQYTHILDCTDNPASRYLISDACVLLQKPLISASALRTEGQLMVLNDPPFPAGSQSHEGTPIGGPCYRCIFPVPPPPESIMSCADGGIIGPVVGTIGVLQALETIKVISGATVAKRPQMLLFSAYQSPQFRTVALRNRRTTCVTCDRNATITKESFESGSLDYVQFCGSLAPVNVLGAAERVSPRIYADVRAHGAPHLLVDVREKTQFDMCALQGSENVPWSVIAADGRSPPDAEPPWTRRFKETLSRYSDHTPIYVICRLGNDSQLAARKFREMLGEIDTNRWIGDIVGGLKAWHHDVDKEFPDY